jgi:hypothetical protein
MLFTALLAACVLVDTPTPAELGGKVAGTLRALRFARVEAHLRMIDKGDEISYLRADADMAPGKLYCELRDHKSTLLAAYSLSDSRVQEFVPSANPDPDLDWTIRNVVTEFDATITQGCDNSVLFTRNDCLHGGWMQTWVGPGSEKADLFARIIVASKVVSIDHAGVACYKASRENSQTDPDGGVFTVTQEIWIERQSNLPIEWNTTQELRKGDDLVSSLRAQRTIRISTERQVRPDWKLDVARLAKTAASSPTANATTVTPLEPAPARTEDSAVAARGSKDPSNK